MPNGATADWIIDLHRELGTIDVQWLTPETPAAIDWVQLDPTGLLVDSQSLLAHSLRYRHRQWEVATRDAAGSLTWQVVPAVQLRRSPLGLQLWFLAQLSHSAGGALPDLGLDGADRIDRQVTARLKFQGQTGSGYVWLSLDDWTAAPEAALLKVATDINGRDSSGACRLADWHTSAGFPWPSKRSLVRGLFEEEFAAVETLTVEPLAEDSVPRVPQ
jgi:hypothetical protein